MPKFPVDAPKERVLRALQLLGFAPVREAEHIALRRTNADGTVTPLTLPNHRTIKSSTLRTICTQCGIPREDFLRIRAGLTSLISSAPGPASPRRTNTERNSAHEDLLPMVMWAYAALFGSIENR